MSTNFFIHIGFSKTGTTSLQKHLFSKHPHVKYHGKPFADEKLKTFLHRLIMEESISYNPGPLKNYLEETRARELSPSQHAVVLSDEMFVSYSKARDKGIVAHRLHDIFAPCKIMITIRHQFELLKAAYLSRGRFLSNVPSKFEGLAVSFEEWLDLSLENYERGYINHADYYKTISYYAHVFGKENVRVFLLEDFIYNKKKYIDDLALFLGVDAGMAFDTVKDAHEHKEITQADLDYELQISRFFPFHRSKMVSKALKLYNSIANRAKKASPAQVEIPGRLVGKFNQIFGEGNKKLGDEFALPLNIYHYPGF